MPSMLYAMRERENAVARPFQMKPRFGLAAAGPFCVDYAERHSARKGRVPLFAALRR